MEQEIVAAVSERQAVLVLGMHRSGTSVLARGLKALGCYLGDNMMPATKDNEKGYWEDLDVVALDDRVLLELQSAWDLPLVTKLGISEAGLGLSQKRALSDFIRSKFSGKNRVAVKDPRISLFSPFWCEAFQASGYAVKKILCLRNPTAIAQSLRARDGFSLRKSYRLWCEYMVSVLADLDDNALVVSYERLLQSPKDEMARIANYMGVSHIELNENMEFDDFVNNFVDNSLSHNHHEDIENSVPISPVVAKLYQQLLTHAKEGVMEKAAAGVIVESVNADSALLESNEVAIFIEDLRNKISELDLERSKLKDTQEKLQHSEYICSLVEERNSSLVGENAALNDLSDELKITNNKARDALSETQSSLDQATSELLAKAQENDALQQMLADSQHQRNATQESMNRILKSKSWRMMRPLRSARRLVSTPRAELRLIGSKVSRALWRMLPLSVQQRYDIKQKVFTKFAVLFGWSSTYKHWVELQIEGEKLEASEDRAIPYGLLNSHTNQSLKRTPTSQSNVGALEDAPVRVITFYLPQFHPIAENNEWWGEGFTEWTNVRPALPQFQGHYQPRIPNDLGYYDLCSRDVQTKQIELAKQYGVEGFCFYFYWFGGKRLLETPTLNYLNDKTLDHPFCLCWANENWCRRWDGLESEILIGQDHSPQDDIDFIEYISQYMNDSRYIKVNGKPLLLVYRPCLLPDAKETVNRWREWCRNNGVGEIYLAYTQSFESADPREYGFDAAIEFPPNNSGPPVVTNQMEELMDNFSGAVYDWNIFLKRSKNYSQKDYTFFRGVNPMWDNTARRKSGGSIFVNSSPEKYQYWLSNAIDDTLENAPSEDEQLIFINAWNEWAEGAYLEPDQQYGYAYLENTRLALEGAGDSRGDLSLELANTLAIVIHAYYPDVLESILSYLPELDVPYKLYVTTPSEEMASVESMLKGLAKPYYLMAVENKGRDVLPFLKLFPIIKLSGHSSLLKLHTKKSNHREDGDIWRGDLFDKLLLANKAKQLAELLMSSSTAGMIGPSDHLVPMSTYWGSNRETVLELASSMGVSEELVMKQPFVAGTMFYSRIDALGPLMELNLTDEDFEPEMGQIDGTMAHAVERLFSVSVLAAGKLLSDSNSGLDDCKVNFNYGHAEADH